MAEPELSHLEVQLDFRPQGILLTETEVQRQGNCSMKWFGNCEKEELVFFVLRHQIAQCDLRQLQLGRFSGGGCEAI